MSGSHNDASSKSSRQLAVKLVDELNDEQKKVIDKYLETVKSFTQSPNKADADKILEMVDPIIIEGNLEKEKNFELLRKVIGTRMEGKPTSKPLAEMWNKATDYLAAVQEQEKVATLMGTLTPEEKSVVSEYVEAVKNFTVSPNKEDADKILGMVDPNIIKGNPKKEENFVLLREVIGTLMEGKPTSKPLAEMINKATDFLAKEQENMQENNPSSFRACK